MVEHRVNRGDEGGEKVLSTNIPVQVLNNKIVMCGIIARGRRAERGEEERDLMEIAVHSYWGWGCCWASSSPDCLALLVTTGRTMVCNCGSVSILRSERNISLFSNI